MKLIFLIVVTLYFFSLSYISAPHEFLNTDLIFLFLIFFIVFTIQILAVTLLQKVHIPENFSYSALLVLNVFCVNLSVSPAFMILPVLTWQIPALFVGLFIAFTAYCILDASKFIANIVTVFLTLGTATVFCLAVISMNPTIAAPTQVPGRTAAKDVVLVDFKSHPNVYFVSFDSLIPRSLLQKYMGLEKTQYHDILDGKFRRFENFFADRVPSLPSLNSLLALDIQLFDREFSSGRPYDFFTGVRPSPLFEIFKYNGYETSTFYRGYFFGKFKGPYVDNYRIAQQGNSKLAEHLNKPSGVCEFIDTSGIKAVRFMGYCKLLSGGVFDGMAKRDDQITPLIELFREGLEKGTPQVVLAYVYSPGHTSAEFDPSDKQQLADYREYYIRESAVTADYLETLLQFLRDEDPTAILYVFGDHGPYLSRRLENPEVSEFVVQDQFGVFGGLFPRDACAQSIGVTPPGEFRTVAMIARFIIKCLADERDPFENSGIYRLPEIAEGFSQRYEDYAYE